MCTILSKDRFVGKNLDSVVNTGMMFTNKRGLIKKAAVFPPDRPLEWVSVFGSVTFSLSGREMPVSGVNEAGLVVEQASLPSGVYPDYMKKPVASCLEATQFLLDTCADVKQALSAMEQISVEKHSWPVRFLFFDRFGNMAALEFAAGEKKVFEGGTDKTRLMNNAAYNHEPVDLECRSAEEMFSHLDKERRPDTVWSNVYDLSKRKIYLKRKADSEAVEIDLGQFDFSPQSASHMLDINAESPAFRPYSEDANRSLISGFFRHPVISQLMKLSDPEAMIAFVADLPKGYDRTSEIVLRFLEGERVKQLPVKGAHKLLILKYLASKFETGKDYTEARVNAIIDDWHTFGDYFILRRELIDSGLLKRLPNGAKYWRETT